MKIGHEVEGEACENELTKSKIKRPQHERVWPFLRLMWWLDSVHESAPRNFLWGCKDGCVGTEACQEYKPWITNVDMSLMNKPNHNLSHPMKSLATIKAINSHPMKIIAALWRS